MIGGGPGDFWYDGLHLSFVEGAMRSRHLLFAVLAALALLATGLSPAAAETKPAAKLTVTYYYLPG